jgi:hypothetical protein
MAEGTLIRPAYVDRLVEALEQRFGGAKVRFEPIRRDRYRFFVIWQQFQDMGHPERQRLVWDVAEAVLQKSDLLNVGMIITLAPSELEEDDSVHGG